MNISWGYKITILYVCFVILIVSLVYTSVHNKEELVSADYYQQELRYQQRIEAMNNANSTEEPITYHVEGRKVTLSFPISLVKGISGEILFYRPSDATKDFKVNMHPASDGTQVIKGKTFTHGAYKMQLSWKFCNKNYFKEELIFIQ